MNLGKSWVSVQKWQSTVPGGLSPVGVLDKRRGRGREPWDSLQVSWV